MVRRYEIENRRMTGCHFGLTRRTMSGFLVAGRWCTGPVRSPAHRTRRTALFVAAEIEHQIEEISENFVMWRVLYGPHGGEVPA